MHGDERLGRREAFLLAAVIWGGLLTAITEILSLFKLLTFGWILASWSVLAFIFCLIYFLQRKKKEVRATGIPRTQFFLAALLGVAAFIVIVTGLIAVIAPPNNWDSMLYHMSRVAHWAQNRSVAYFPTHNLGYLSHNPFAEFSILHFQILTGGDLLANLVQWLSFVGCLIGVSLIAMRLGAKERGQVFSVILCATVPIGILQAPSTQNNYVMSFWLVCFAYFLLTINKCGMNSLRLSCAGISLGLALLTKSYAYFYALPFCVWFFASVIKKSGFKVFGYGAVIAFFALLVNLGYFVRNYELFGNILGDRSTGGTLINEVFSIPAFLSNVIRNIALHLGTGFSFLNGFFGGGVKFLHRIIGVGMSDPRLTFLNHKFFIPASPFDENITPNTVHFLLIALSVFLFFAMVRLRQNRLLLKYLVLVSAGFLIFCFFVKWQMNNTRLHLPVFVLFCAFTGTVLAEIRLFKTINLIILIAVLSSLPALFMSKPRPVIGESNIFNTPRIEQYFTERKWIKGPATEVSDFIISSGCREVGMYYGKLDTEYPFWALLQNKGADFRIVHVNVNNISAKKGYTLPYNSIKPCAIIACFRDEEARKTDTLTTERGRYRRKMISRPYEVFLPDTDAKILPLRD
jgi:hypothetical protein